MDRSYYKKRNVMLIKDMQETLSRVASIRIVALIYLGLMRTELLLGCMILITSGSFLNQHNSNVWAQDQLSPKSSFNEHGVSGDKARFFLTLEARLAMGPSRQIPEDSVSYEETLFFASPLDGGVEFVTKVLRAGGLANASQFVLKARSPKSAKDLHDLLSKLSVPYPSPNTYGNFPIVVREVKVGSEPSNWPSDARNNHSRWIEPYRNGWEESTTSYRESLHIVLIYDEECKKPISAGILRELNMFSVSDRAIEYKADYGPPPSISIWVDSSESVTLEGNELKRCEVFTLSSCSHGDSRKHIASSLPNVISTLAFEYANIHARNSAEKDVFKEYNMKQRANIRDFGSYLAWASEVIGPELRGQVIAEVSQEEEKVESIYGESKWNTVRKSALDNYLQILKSARSSALVDTAEPNRVPDGISADKKANTDPEDSKAQAELAKKLTKEIVKINVDKAINSEEVCQWVEAKIADSMRRNPGIPNSRKGILATIELGVGRESEFITGSGIVSKGLLVGLDVFTKPLENEKALKEIRDFARKGDPYSAWKKTLSVSLDISSDAIPGQASSVASVLSSFAGEVLADATVDIYVPLGNRIAWLMWEKGYSPRRPRFAKDEFDNGVKRPNDTSSSPYAIERPIPMPTVPAVPNGVPMPSDPSGFNAGGKPPRVVPPSAVRNGRETRPMDVKEPIIPVNVQIPFVPVVTPVPLPPPIYRKPG